MSGHGEHDELAREHIGDAPAMDAGALLGTAVVLGTPAAFLLALALRYLLTDAACASASARVALELATLPAVAMAATALWQGWRRLGTDRLEPIGESERDGLRFAAVLALLTGAVFMLASVALWAPSLFLSPCAR